MPPLSAQETQEIFLQNNNKRVRPTSTYTAMDIDGPDYAEQVLYSHFVLQVLFSEGYSPVDVDDVLEEHKDTIYDTPTTDATQGLSKEEKIERRYMEQRNNIKNKLMRKRQKKT